MSSQDQARECVEKHQGKHGKTIEGVYYTFDIQLLDGASDVKLLDLPYCVTNETIEREMAKYGKILSIKEQVHGEKSPLAGVLSAMVQQRASNRSKMLMLMVQQRQYDPLAASDYYQTPASQRETTDQLRANEGRATYRTPVSDDLGIRTLRINTMSKDRDH
uniref:Uncharacterized protein n=1 Tax=Anopheles atroparvus TaxID=41427 RepID=A0A182JMN0_ANOAO